MVQKAVNRLWIAALLFLLPVLYFLPGKVILAPGDGWTQNLGVRYLIGESIKHGILPLWNPYIFAGMPLLATVYPGALYPPNWLFAILPPVWAMNIVVISTFQIALIGMYLFARSLNLSRLGAFVAGITFTFGGFMIAHIGHTSRIAAAAWLPWVLLALEKLFQENKWRWVCLGALFIFLQFVAGEPQMLFYTALTCAAYVMFSLLFRAQNAVRWKFILSGAIMALCGVLFSLPLLLPARELQAQGARANMAYEHFSAFSLPPKQILAFIFPYFFGGAAQPPYLQAPWGTSFWGESTVNASAGYVGLIALMLVVVAIISAQKRSLVWLWLFIASASLFLAFGGYLPFHLNEYLHQVPGYNVFRGSYRHLLEFTFALAMLAGTGLSRLAELEEKKKWQALLIGIGTVGLLVLGTAIVYCRFAEKLVTTAIRLKEFGHLSNAEAFIPLIVFCLSTIALLMYAKWKNTTAAAFILLIAMIDIASFGWFYEWRNPEIKEMSQRIPDAPTVQFIKSKESDLNSFRIVSYGATPFKENYELLDYPNNSIMRGLQSVNGYDVLRLSRVASLAGDLDEEGKVIDTSAFAAEHHGFDLFNVKYLLREKPHPSNLAATVDIQGIKFNELPLSLKNSPGSHFEMRVAKSPATEIALISSLANSGDLKDGTPVLKIKLYGSNGKIIERELLVGRDSSEWAYDRSDVKANIKHSRAPVIESWEVSGYQGHRYLARLSFERTEIERIEINYAASSAECFVMKASLFDVTTKTSLPLDGVDMPGKRWQMVFNEGPIEIYQNKKVMPRAWFVKNLLVQPEAETLKAIREGKLTNGEPFDPSDTALLELEDFGGREYSLPPIGEVTNPEIKIVKYAPNRIVLETNNTAGSFLVLSEIYYRGWDARIDGKKASVYRVNHTLRGLALPPGNHRIEYLYRAPSFWNGAIYFGLSLAILLLGSVISVGRPKENLTAGIIPYLKILPKKLSMARASESADSKLLAKPIIRNSLIPVIFLLGLATLWFYYLSKPTDFLPIRSDGVGYYLYLPGVFLHHDITLETTIKQQFAGKIEEWLGVAPYPATGRLLDRYPLGEAIMLIPFFLSGHVIALIFQVPTDGFTWPYQLMAALAGLAYLSGGLLFLRSALERYFSSSTSLLTIIAITFGTNLFHYGTTDNIFSHIFSFFLFSALLYLIPQWYESPRKLDTICLAIVAGLIVIVRPTNIIFLIFVPLLGVYNFESFQARVKLVRTQMPTILPGVATFLFTVVPLFLYWKYITGHWIVNSYQGISFHWSQPEIVNVLFSIRKGLFFWSPILLLGFVGLCFVRQYWKGFLLPAMILLIAHTYVIASWPMWYYGGSFGHRAFTESLPVFAVGYAALLESARTKPLLYRSILAFSALLILLSVKLMIQYWNGIIPYDLTTLELLASTFFQFTK